MGPGSPLAVARVGRDDNRFSLEHQPAAAGNDCRLGVPVSGLLFTGNAATPTCRAVSARGIDIPWAGIGLRAERRRSLGTFWPTKRGGKSAVPIRPGALPPDP